LITKCNNISNFSRKVSGTHHKVLLHSFNKLVKKYDEDNDEEDTEEPYIEIIIADEFSMVDIFMYNTLLKWCEYFNCKLILCGDMDQLPPIGMGRPFEDLINSQYLTVTKLTEIKRQDDGHLKQLIMNINNHKLSMSNFGNESCEFIEHDFKNREKTIEIFEKFKTDFGRDVDFITPQNGYLAGVDQLNEILQNIYNPDNIFVKNNFKEGDKIIRIENKYDDKFIRVNGDMGYIYFNYNSNNKAIHATIKYDDGEKENVSLNTLIDSFSLNYISTVHKYQGSQANHIVFVCSNLHKGSLGYYNINRLKLVYTAISRACKKIIVIGNKDILLSINTFKSEKYISSFMQSFNNSFVFA